MIAREATINLTPVFEVLLDIVGYGLLAFVVFTGAGAVLRVLMGNEDEFGEIIIFWGAIAIVVALLVLAFTTHILAFE